MAPKKKSAATVKELPLPKTLDPISPDSYDQFEKFVKRLKKDPDFQGLVATIEAFRQDYNEAGYEPTVLQNSGISGFYSGGRFAFDNLLELINGIVHPKE